MTESLDQNIENYMTHLHKKVKNGKAYYYLRDIKRIDGKPKVVNQVYLGSPDTIANKIKSNEGYSLPDRVESLEFGSLFIAFELEKKLNIISIIDSIIHSKGQDPDKLSAGKLFFLGMAKRLIDPLDSRNLEDWYSTQDLGSNFLKDRDQITSTNFWDVWSNISIEKILQIGPALFDHLTEFYHIASDFVSIDTSNAFTFSNQQEEDLSSVEPFTPGQHVHKQINLLLFMDRKSRLPVDYLVYEENRYDPDLFSKAITQLIKENPIHKYNHHRLTIVIDKGVTNEHHLSQVVQGQKVSFVTKYYPFFVEDLVRTDINYFFPLDMEENRRLDKIGKSFNKILAWRTKAPIWGENHTVVVTFDPKEYRKNCFLLERNLEVVRQSLMEFRRNCRENHPRWQETEKIYKRYQRLCDRLHFGSQYYKIDFGPNNKAEDMTFRKIQFEVNKAKEFFGKTFIVTNNHDWSTVDIVRWSNERVKVEGHIKHGITYRRVSTKASVNWTENKVHCYLLSNIIALTVKRVFEIELEKHLMNTSFSTEANSAFRAMRSLSSLSLRCQNKSESTKIIESPNKYQSFILSAFGYKFDQGVIRKR